MDYQVPMTNIIAIVFTMVVSIGLPLFACVWLKRRYKTDVTLISALVGVTVFMFFAMTLEQLLHSVVLNAAGDLLQNNIWLYAIYGGLAAGLFEETGRFVGMKFLMKRSLTKENALMYGIGHGGAESIMLVGMSYVSNLMIALTINQGGLPDLLANVEENMQDTLIEGLSPLWEMGSMQFYMAGIERICAFALQVALSYLVYTAVRYGKNQNFVLAIAIHAFVNAVTVLLAQVLPVYVVMLVLIAMVAAVGWYVSRLYRGEEQQG